MAVIYRVSAMPASDVPGGNPQIAHFTEYAVLAALLIFALKAGGRAIQTAALAILLAALYAITDEFHQSFVPGRVPDVMDWLFDILGATVLAATWFLGQRKAALRRPS